MLDHTTEIRVRYADTDQMHFVHHEKYVEYFEVARTEMLRDIGLTYHAIEENGFMLPLVEVNVKYKNPAFYDDLLFVRAFVEEIPVLKVKINYSVFRTDQQILIAEGFSEHVFMNKETKKAVRPPGFFIEAIKKYYIK